MPKNVGELASKKTDPEELKQKLARYFNQASSDLANHCLEEAKIAGFTHGLFEEEEDGNG